MVSVLKQEEEPEEVPNEPEEVPEEPRRRDYDSWDEYEKAHDEWESRINEIVKKQLPDHYTTMEEMRAWCDSRGIEMDDSIEAVDGRILTKFTEEFDRLNAIYPEVADYTMYYEGEEIRGSFKLTYEYTMDYLMEANGGLSFGESCRDAVGTIEDQLYAQSKGHRVNSSDSLGTLIDHEFGHRVYESIKYADGYTTHDRLAMRDDLMENVYGKSGMSEYATTNDYELFAEGFASLTQGLDTEFSSAIEGFIERWRKV